MYDDLTGFVLSDGSTPGNYLLFSGVTEETLVITPQWTGGGTWFPTVNVVGMQIVGAGGSEEPVVPEPAVRKAIEQNERN